LPPASSRYGPCGQVASRPYRGDQGKALTIQDPDEVKEFYRTHPEANLGACLSPIGHSPIVVVDVDICDVPEGEKENVWAQLKELGVTTKAAVWAQRTGRDNYQVFYWVGSRDIPLRHVNAGGLHIDLLCNGYVVVAPSDTSKEEPKVAGLKGGGPYRWLNGHSPWEIPISAIEELPEAALGWWSEQAAAPVRSSSAEGESAEGRNGVTELLTGPLIGDYRNVGLTRVAGRLAQKHRKEDLLPILLGLNQTRCSPPLPEREIEAIAHSISSREAAKPKAWLEQDGVDELHALN